MSEPEAVKASGSGTPMHSSLASASGVTAAARPPVAEPIRHDIEFTATTGEYFRIWIVNLALTLLTLGIYSAWAKVRKKRYFYGHTFIAGDSFEYRGAPLAILKGRIVAVVLFVAYSLGGKLSPIIGAMALVVLLIALPFLITRSLAFNAYNSVYRNIRFDFSGRYWPLLRLLIGGGLAVILTLGIAFPYFQARFTRFVAEHHAFGNTRFGIERIARAFYGVYLRVLLIVLLYGVLGGLIVSGGLANPDWFGSFAGPAILMLLIYSSYLAVYAFVHARTTNIIWNALSIGPVRFASSLRGRDLIALYFTNILAIVLTLGLATPWAVVRTFRYRARKTLLFAQGSLEQFVAGESLLVSATGQEVGEMFDVDFGL